MIVPTRALALAAGALLLAAAESPAQRLPTDSLAIARRYAQWFLGGQTDSLVAHIPPAALADLRGREGIAQAQQTVSDRAGREAAVIEERFVWRGGKRQYWRTMQMTGMEEHFLLRFVLESDGRIGGYGLGLAQQAPPVDSGGPPIRRP